MTGIRMFDAAPSAHIHPDTFATALGLESRELAHTILWNPYLKSEIDALVREALPALPSDISPIHEPLFGFVTMCSPDDLDLLARYTTILVNHRAILATTDGTEIDAAFKWCGTRSLLDLIRKNNLPVFDHVPVLSLVSVEALDLYAQAVKARVLGLLPPPYHYRFRLRFPPDQTSEPPAFQYGESDRLKFLECTVLAHAVLAGMEGRHAAH